jgi:hypothetical protein
MRFSSCVCIFVFRLFSFLHFHFGFLFFTLSRRYPLAAVYPPMLHIPPFRFLHSEATSA